MDQCAEPHRPVLRQHAFVCVALALFAASVVPRAAASPPSQLARTTIASPLDLKRLVDLAAERTGVRVEYDAAVLSGVVTLRMGAEDHVETTALWPLVNQVLAARGFTTVRAPGGGGGIDAADDPRPLVRVVRAADAAAGARLEPGEGFEALRGTEAGYVSVIVRAKFVPARDLVEAARAVMSKPGMGSQAVVLSEGGGAAGVAGGGGGGGAGGGLIVLSDLRPRLEEALRIIEQIDRPPSGEGVVVEEYRSTGLGAAKLATLVMQVLAKRDSVVGGKRGEKLGVAPVAAGDAAAADRPAPDSHAGDLRGDVVASPDGRTLLIVAPPSAVPRWRSLLATLDRREAVVMRTFVPRRYGATRVAGLIAQSIDSEGDERFKVVVDDLSGAVVVTGVESKQGEIAALIERLEESPPMSGRPVRRIAVRNRPVNEVLPLVQHLLSASGRRGEEPGAWSAPLVPARPSAGASAIVPSGANGAAAASGTHSGEIALDAMSTDEFTIAADEPTNTIVAAGPPASLDRLETLIGEMDVRQPQVMVEVLLLNLSDSQSLDFGVELERIGRSGGTLAKLASLFGLSSSSGSAIDAVGRSVAGTATGFTGLVLDPGEFSVVVRALETLNDGRTLTIPKVLVSNNENAQFDSVNEQPVLSVNASDTVATTSFGGFQQAGTTIQITPRISTADHMGLEYTVTRGTFVGESSNPSLPPPRQQTTTSSVVTIPDGHAVVVGGFEEEQEGMATDQVPWIGNVPIVGELFKSRSNSSSRSRFYVFIRATVLRDDALAGLKHLSERDLGKAGIQDGWPEVEPRVIR